MKKREEIEKMADSFYLKRTESINGSEMKGILISAKKGGFVDGWEQCLAYMADRKYTEVDIINAAKYGYEFRDTTSFPDHKFEDSCIDNTKQWLKWYEEEKENAEGLRKKFL